MTAPFWALLVAMIGAAFGAGWGAVRLARMRMGRGRALLLAGVACLILAVVVGYPAGLAFSQAMEAASHDAVTVGDSVDGTVGTGVGFAQDVERGVWVTLGLLAGAVIGLAVGGRR